MVWCRLVRCGLVWFGVVWYGVVRCGVVRCGASKYAWNNNKLNIISLYFVLLCFSRSFPAPVSARSPRVHVCASACVRVGACMCVSVRACVCTRDPLLPVPAAERGKLDPAAATTCVELILERADGTCRGVQARARTRALIGLALALALVRRRRREAAARLKGVGTVKRRTSATGDLQRTVLTGVVLCGSAGNSTGAGTGAGTAGSAGTVGRAGPEAVGLAAPARVRWWTRCCDSAAASNARMATACS